MLKQVLKVLMLLFPVFLPAQAFWWKSSAQEAPTAAPTIMKQIPLTYFRTYTYQQPLPSNQVQFPMNSNQMQFPMLSSTDYITNYPALTNSPYLNPIMPIMPMALPRSNGILVETKPVVNVVRTVVPAPLPPPPPTTTPEPTTTTTTTPEPTTTTTEAPTTVQVELPAPTVVPYIKTDAIVNVETTYPAFNRKVFTNHFNINYNRPVYPYPQYAVEGKPQVQVQIPGNVQMVPCMCPIDLQNTGYPAGYQSPIPIAGGPTSYPGSMPIAGNPSNSIFLAQGRTSAGAEASLAPSGNVEINSEAEASANLVDDLSDVKLVQNQDSVVAEENNIA